MPGESHFKRRHPNPQVPLERWAGFTAALALACCTGCPTALPLGGAEVVGAALAAIGADGTLELAEHCSRNLYNDCPASRPAPGTDADGITWTEDRFLFGLLPNPFHAPLDCYRGTSPELGWSSYQCCYDGQTLVEDGPLAGSFDFVDPQRSPIAGLYHLLFDVLPGELWKCPPP